MISNDPLLYESFLLMQRHIVVDTFFGYDEESMDSETSSVASFRMERTPATPDDDMHQVARLSCPWLYLNTSQ